MGFGYSFAAFETLFFIVFIVVLAIFAINAAKGMSEWSRNNQSPRLTVPVVAVSKRLAVSHRNHMQAEGMVLPVSSTSYYVTFQVASGDRMELQVSGKEYGMLAEGDRGTLSFQGTRYLSFQREPLD